MKLSRTIMAMLSGIAVALFSVSASATDHYQFWQSQAPIICGESKQVYEYSVDNGWTPFSVSYGKVNGKPEGETAFVVTHWLKKGTTEQMVTMQAPNGSESCIVYMSFDTIINPSFNVEKRDL